MHPIGAHVPSASNLLSPLHLHPIVPQTPISSGCPETTYQHSGSPRSPYPSVHSTVRSGRAVDANHGHRGLHRRLQCSGKAPAGPFSCTRVEIPILGAHAPRPARPSSGRFDKRQTMTAHSKHGDHHSRGACESPGIYEWTEEKGSAERDSRWVYDRSYGGTSCTQINAFRKPTQKILVRVIAHQGTRSMPS